MEEAAAKKQVAAEQRLSMEDEDVDVSETFARYQEMEDEEEWS